MCVALAQVLSTIVIRLKLLRNKTPNQGTGKLSNPIRNIHFLLGLVTITYIILVQIMNVIIHVAGLPQDHVFPRLGIGINHALVLITVLIYNKEAILFSKRKISSIAFIIYLSDIKRQKNRVTEIQIDPIPITPKRTNLISPTTPVEENNVPGTVC